MKKRIRLLLIDDDSDDAWIFGEALQELDMPIDYTYELDSSHALQVLQEAAVEIPHFIFLDLNMPKTDGFECLKRIKTMKALDKVPVIVYSTSASPRDMAETERLGGTDFLIKTNSIKTLTSKLLEIFSQHQVLY